jgi:hypothetical protein
MSKVKISWKIVWSFSPIANVQSAHPHTDFGLWTLDSGLISLSLANQIIAFRVY